MYFTLTLSITALSTPCLVSESSEVYSDLQYSRVAQYYNCWYWEHLTHACHIQDTKCQKCDSLYRVENYMLLAWYCKVNTKFNSSREATAAGIFCSHTLSI